MTELSIPSAIHLRWKVTSELEHPTSLGHENVVFNLSPGPGLFGQFSIPSSLSWVPHNLTPTVTYHQVIRNELKKLGVVQQENAFPYKLNVPGLGLCSLTMGIRRFLPNVLSLTVSLEPAATSVSIPDLISWQQLGELRPVSDIVRWTIGMAESLNHKTFDANSRFSAKPALWLDGISASDFAENTNKFLPAYVGILIRHADYPTMDSGIASGIAEKNRMHNLKYANELLLLNKQGILYVTAGKSSSPQVNRFKRTHDLYEIALVAQVLLERYLSFHAAQEDLADFFLTRASQWVEEPELFLGSSTTNQLVWKLLMNELFLDRRLGMVKQREDLWGSMLAKSPYFDQFSKTWWKDPEFPTTLSDTIEASTDFDLSFIADANLRRIVLTDFQEAKRTFQARAFKATIVLCGSIVEAMLIASLARYAELSHNSESRLSMSSLQRMRISEAIELAEQRGLIKDRALFQLLEPLRSYRNMIHPGSQTRRELTPDEDKAEIALRTVRLLAKDLRRLRPGLDER